MQKAADLAEKKMSNPVHDRIQSEVSGNDVLLFMKGTPVFPQCGFSAATVQILSNLGVKFKAIDVLKDPEIRSGIKEFSNWPTIPQLYVKGEFVGGCDIIREMYEADELAPFLAEKGIALENV
jgi:monothiol glutaredoxin